MIKKSLLFFTLVSLVFLRANEAQVDDEVTNANEAKKVRLEKSSVSAGVALESDIVNIPASITVIDSTHIQKMPNTKIADIVNVISGVRVDNNTNFNARPQIRIRGVNSGTLVMLDGVILSDLEGEARILNQISLYDVERVEVAKGGYSSLYGTGAIGGVIHFITAMPEKFELQAIAGYGNEIQKDTADKNTFRFYGSVGDVFFDKRLKVKLSAGFTTTDGYSSYPTYLSSTNAEANDAIAAGAQQNSAGQVILGTGGDRAVQSYDISFKSSLELGKRDEVGLSLRLSNHNYDVKNFQSYLRDNQGNPTYLLNTKNYFIGSGLGGIGSYTHIIGNLNYLHSFEQSTLKITLSSMNLLSWWQDAIQDGKQSFSNGAGSTQDTDSSSNYLDFIYADTHLSDHIITLGAQFRYYTYTQKQRNMTNWRDYHSRTDYRVRFGTEAVAGSVYFNMDSLWVDSPKFGAFGTSIGLRYDYWRNFNGYYDNFISNSQESKKNQSNSVSILSPKFAVIYTPLDTQEHTLRLKASVGRGFRMATLRNKYQFTHAQTYWEVNENLKEEHAINTEVGVEYDNNALRTSLYFYNLEMFDMIYRSGSGAQADPYKFINAGRGRINGIEFDINIPIWHALEIQANYTLSNAKVLKNTARPDSVGKQFVGLPLHTLNAGVNYLPQYGVFASVWAHYTPAFYNDDSNSPIIPNVYGSYDSQFALNAKVGYTFKNNLQLCAQFLNITNNRYYDFYRVAGASYYLQIAYKL
ncbi:TonB-dependent receptor [Helicobacter sp. 23-1046]